MQLFYRAMQMPRLYPVTLLGLASAVVLVPSVRAAAPETSVEPAAKSLAETLDPTLDAPLATDLPAEKAPPAGAPSANVTVNLINRLVQKGILSQAEAAEMIKQAEDDAATAAAKADIAALPAEPSPQEETRVTYIPEVVRNQMRDQIQQELLAQAREEKWSEKSSPEWTSRFRPFGDIRARSENTFFPAGNGNREIDKSV
jgi:hypothetical protein